MGSSHTLKGLIFILLSTEFQPTPLFLSKAFDGVGCVLFQTGNKVHLLLLPLFTVPAQGFLMTLQQTVQSDGVHISHPHTWRENE